ncbi:hypothetical protein HALLA_00560 (plasmid) [Halostagnicola larsenii XH-48]|uniref:Uncharacterized protein n=1 Tax=Halostagnicola larsenii XH-48 TaxID=797299 RepID=W0JX84_9EURY|nr:hypothetical protein HALLA_00560 [Halostagnicola larsenii XH-48]
MPLGIPVFERLDLEFELDESSTKACTFTEMFAEFEGSDKCVSQSAATFSHQLFLI